VAGRNQEDSCEDCDETEGLLPVGHCEEVCVDTVLETLGLGSGIHLEVDYGY
jgi:hypothetical protein